MRQFHAIVIFRLKSISDLDSGSLLRYLVNPYTQNLKSLCRNKTGREIAKTTLTSG